MSHAFGAATARVSLVGAGPGDPELLTLKALRALQAADVILHDQLVSAEVLALAPPHVERIDVGKKGYGRACKQGDINDLMVALANAGRRVVRLKAGDPLMFGRLEEEIAALEAAGIAFEVVPGISAAQGAAARLGVPLTRRRGARRFQAITGHAERRAVARRLRLVRPRRSEGDHRRLYAQGDHRRAVRRADCAGASRRSIRPSPCSTPRAPTRRSSPRQSGRCRSALQPSTRGAPCIILIGVDATKRAARRALAGARARERMTSELQS